MKKEEEKEKKNHNYAIYTSAIAICVAIVLLFMAANTAALVVEKDIGTLTSEADTIVIGNVTGLQSQWEEGKIFTYVTVSARDYIKGAKGSEVTIKVPGGTVGNISCHVTDTPAFEKGEGVLVFLKEKDSYFDVVGCYQGKYTIEDNEVLRTGLSVDDFAALILGEIISKQVIEKGRTEPAIMKVAHEVFNLSEAEGIIASEEAATPENESKPIINESENNVTISSPGWVTILHEGFPSGWPSGKWSRSGKSPCAYTWDEDNYAHYAGSYSAWCADYSLGGCSDLDPAYNNYPNNMEGWMKYGPFDLSDANDAKMTFYFRGRTELNYDYFYYLKSSNSISWSGYWRSGSWLYGPYTGNDGRKWYKNELSLQNLCGDPTVWIAFKFTSDSSVTYEGIFVDNVHIQKYVPSVPDPVITSIAPSYGPAKATQLGSSAAASDSTRVTISGSNFGTSQGYVKFWGVGTTYYNAAIESWSNSQIVCRVPGGASSYNKPDGTGDVYVRRSDGRTSNYARFRVAYSYGGGKWPINSGTPPNTRVTYKVNPNTADCTGEEVAVQSGANTWNNAGANFNFVYGGTTSKTSVGRDGENSVIWKNYGYTSWLARAWTYWNTLNPRTIVENDMEFNDYYTWSTSPSCTPGRYDVWNLATHEFGHWLTLKDLYGTMDSEKTMYGRGASCETKKRTLHSDDIAGIRAIYGTGVTPTLQVNISESPDPVTPGGNSQVTVHVTSSVDGSPVQGASVTVSATCGSVTPTSGTTDTNGDFRPTYNAPTYPTTCTISATASKTGYTSGSGSDTITVGVATVVKIDPSTQTVSPGPFTVNVTVDPAVPIAGVQFDLSFNSSLVSANSVTEGNLLNQGGASTYFSSGIIDNTAGTITGVVGAITTPGQTVSSSGVFATIQMTAKSDAGTSPLDLSNVIVGDINGNPVSITVNDGTVTVEPCPDWDVNCDGNVNVLDMIRIGQHWGETGSPHWIREDVNRDGHINVLDMILIGQHWTG